MAVEIFRKLAVVEEFNTIICEEPIIRKCLDIFYGTFALKALRFIINFIINKIQILKIQRSMQDPLLEEYFVVHAEWEMLFVQQKYILLEDFELSEEQSLDEHQILSLFNGFLDSFKQKQRDTKVRAKLLTLQLAPTVLLEYYTLERQASIEILYEIREAIPEFVETHAKNSYQSILEYAKKIEFLVDYFKSCYYSKADKIEERKKQYALNETVMKEIDTQLDIIKGRMNKKQLDLVLDKDIDWLMGMTITFENKYNFILANKGYHSHYCEQFTEEAKKDMKYVDWKKTKFFYDRN